jgi:hypothetical protein
MYEVIFRDKIGREKFAGLEGKKIIEGLKTVRVSGKCKGKFVPVL